ncbi:GNAT family N-acetyltransferase [Neorhizobium sp. BETTINA12A]|uniref:GNAT family N-acetyltransferase n=1 Tax=Neorhizobium sp. BETTINA12A TaxID=2908924 RepID=UPI001FF51A53|nr:GNAT family N-acetyltransferase [Neorhizobium sp. BETTINA12A]MCJ9751761.1 GNAT family N-acetyltransferase [Neorhizobium sp. BETTINA12A]
MTATTTPAIIRPLEPADRTAWEPLWEAYLRFYETVLPKEMYDLTWSRLHDSTEPMHALGAFDETGKMIAIAHVIFHRSCWLPESTCYLQDLYVKNTLRGRGTGAALIEAVADLARANGAGRLYWLTQESNAAARRLYDRIAQNSGFIQYRKAL